MEPIRVIPFADYQRIQSGTRSEVGVVRSVKSWQKKPRANFAGYEPFMSADVDGSVRRISPYCPVRHTLPEGAFPGNSIFPTADCCVRDSQWYTAANRGRANPAVPSPRRVSSPGRRQSGEPVSGGGTVPRREAAPSPSPGSGDGRSGSPGEW